MADDDIEEKIREQWVEYLGVYGQPRESAVESLPVLLDLSSYDTSISSVHKYFHALSFQLEMSIKIAYLNSRNRNFQYIQPITPEDARNIALVNAGLKQEGLWPQ